MRTHIQRRTLFAAGRTAVCCGFRHKSYILLIHCIAPHLFAKAAVLRKSCYDLASPYGISLLDVYMFFKLHYILTHIF